MRLYVLKPAAFRWAHVAVQDGVINRDEFNYAMFKTLNQSNIFVEKVRFMLAPWSVWAGRQQIAVLEICKPVVCLRLLSPASVQAACRALLLHRACTAVNTCSCQA